MPIESSALCWFLQGPSANCVLRVNERGYLKHSRWGARIRAESIIPARPAILQHFSPYPAGASKEYSPDTLPPEFPAANSGDALMARAWHLRRVSEE